MVETSGGLLFAQVAAETCIACGLCLRACGGAYLAPELLPGHIDPFKGEVLAAYYGYASDPEIRLKGQSGGVVTALLAFMLESGRVDQAEIDLILDKISEKGYDSLTKEEKQKLFNASKH